MILLVSVLSTSCSKDFRLGKLVGLLKEMLSCGTCPSRCLSCFADSSSLSFQKGCRSLIYEGCGIHGTRIRARLCFSLSRSTLSNSD